MKHKNKTQMVEKEKPYISYEHYVLLREYIDNQIEKAHVMYVDALAFIPVGANHQKTRDYAYEVYRKKYANFERIKQELQFAVMSAYRDHPNPDIRKFWRFEKSS